MYWQEKIDLVQRKFPPPLFKDPFHNGKRIIEAINRNFQCSPAHPLSKKQDKLPLKEAVLLRQMSIEEFYKNELDRLPLNMNYWLLLMEMPMGYGPRVYDCQKDALRYLLYLSSGLDEQKFYIVDKKYEWAIYINRYKNITDIYQSGKILTSLL